MVVQCLYKMSLTFHPSWVCTGTLQVNEEFYTHERINHVENDMPTEMNPCLCREREREGEGGGGGEREGGGGERERGGIPHSQYSTKQGSMLPLILTDLAC